MTEKKLYTISEIIKDAGIARSTFDKFAEANNLRPVKTEKRGKKFYSLKDKEFVVSHYVSGKGKEEKRSSPITKLSDTMKLLNYSVNKFSSLRKPTNNSSTIMIS